MDGMEKTMASIFNCQEPASVNHPEISLKSQDGTATRE